MLRALVQWFSLSSFFARISVNSSGRFSVKLNLDTTSLCIFNGLMIPLIADENEEKTVKLRRTPIKKPALHKGRFC